MQVDGVPDESLRGLHHCTRRVEQSEIKECRVRGLGQLPVLLRASTGARGALITRGPQFELTESSLI